VADVIIKGQREAELAKVRTYHETGRLISAHVMNHRGRADYGSQAVARLSADLKIDRSVLQRCVRFALTIPNWATWPNLAWAHFRVLIPIEDERLRQSLAAEADRAGWPVHRLEARIREVLPPEPVSVDLATSASLTLLTPRRGTPGTYRVVAGDDGPAVDLGFACFVDLGPDTDLTAGALVQLDAADRARPAPDATKSDLFTYPATVLKLVDGDTLWVKIYLGTRRWVKQKLRLRDLDAPELATPKGLSAKRFVEALLARTKAVTICTTKPDKYDRYLADVFLKSYSREEIFLNNALLTAGHAAIKRAWEFKDWDDAQ
jgi:endonuclease YncB( thermonuclease family)